MFSKGHPKSSLFSQTQTIKSGFSPQQMKLLVLRLMDESPKAKLRYGTMRDVIRKPSVHFSQALPECSCTPKKTCAACHRLSVLRGHKESAPASSVHAAITSSTAATRLPSVPSMEFEELALLDSSELSWSKDSEESSDTESAVAEVLQNLFQEADHDAKRAAKDTVRQYRNDLLSEQTKRFDAISQGLMSRNAEILSDFVERQHRLEVELKSAERNIDGICPTSPVSALINEMEQHRIGRESDFRNRIKTVRSATLRSSEIEKTRAEMLLALGKLQNCMNRFSRVTDSGNVRLNEAKQSLLQNVAQLSSLNVDSMQPDSIAQIIAEANRISDESLSALDDYESAAKLASSQQQQQQPQPPPVSYTQPEGQIVPSLQQTLVPIQPLIADRQAIAQDARQYIDNWQARLKPFTEDPNFKQKRQELKFGVNNLVNMVSSDSESSSRISVKLNMMLDGNTVEVVAGRNVSAKCHELGVDFVKFAICQKLIGQAEEEISSQPSVAVPLANVALSLVLTRPDMAKLLVSFFYTTCPLLIPFAPIAGDPNLDSILEKLGYKKRADGSSEGIERFLKRMSGIVTLFATMAVVQVPSNQPKPITVGTIWAILAHLLKLPPFPDLTPTILYELLKNCSKQLFEAYGRQFVKLALSIKLVFLPKLDPDSGSVSTLKHFLNTEVAAISSRSLSQNA